MRDQDMDGRSEGSDYLKILQNIVKNMSTSGNLTPVQRHYCGKIQEQLNIVTNLWQSELIIERDTILIKKRAKKSILGHMTLVLSHMQTFCVLPNTTKDTNFQYFERVLNDLIQIILDFKEI